MLLLKLNVIVNSGQPDIYEQGTYLFISAPCMFFFRYYDEIYST